MTKCLVWLLGWLLHNIHQDLHTGIIEKNKTGPEGSSREHDCADQANVYTVIPDCVELAMAHGCGTEPQKMRSAKM